MNIPTFFCHCPRTFLFSYPIGSLSLTPFSGLSILLYWVRMFLFQPSFEFLWLLRSPPCRLQLTYYNPTHSTLLQKGVEFLGYALHGNYLSWKQKLRQRGNTMS